MAIGHTSTLPPQLPHLSPELHKSLGPSTRAVLPPPACPELPGRSLASASLLCSRRGGSVLLTRFLSAHQLLRHLRSAVRPAAPEPGRGGGCEPRAVATEEGEPGPEGGGSRPRGPPGEGEGGHWPGAGTTGVLSTKCPSLNASSGWHHLGSPAHPRDSQCLGQLPAAIVTLHLGVPVQHASPLLPRSWPEFRVNCSKVKAAWTFIILLT